jgi:hypothetical protein
LTSEAKAASGTGHGSGNKLIQLSKGGTLVSELAEANVVQRLIVNHHNLIGILNELLDGQDSVVGLDDDIRHLVIIINASIMSNSAGNVNLINE